MNFAVVKNTAVDLFFEASFVHHIENNADDELTLELMGELIEDYDTYVPLIDILSKSIESWEDHAEEFFSI